MTELTSKYVPSHYTHLASIYSQNEFNAIQKILRNLAYNCLYNARYPILKLLKAICRRMLINEFEGVFFAFAVQVNKWNINDQVIQNHCSQVRDIVCYSTQNSQYKSLTLYILLCAYTVKYYLNEDIEMYTTEMNKICPNFEEIFESWAKKYAMTTLKINPKFLNHAYKQIFLNDEQSFIQYDYNSLVDNLLQISPSYNAQKDKQKERHDHYSQNNRSQEIQHFQIIKCQFVKQQHTPVTVSFPLVSSDSVNIQRSKSVLFQQSPPPRNLSNSDKIKTKPNKNKNKNIYYDKQTELLNPIIESKVQQSDFQESKFELIKQQYIQELPLFKKQSGISEYLR